MNNRTDNLVWTMAENYDFQINYSFFGEEIKDKYKIEVLGYLYKKYNMNLVGEFLNKNSKSKSNSRDLYYIAELTMENSLADELLKERPGVIDEKKRYINRINEKYDFTAPKDIRDELEKAYYEDLSGSVPKINGTLYEMFKEIKSYNYSDTAALILFLNSLYKKYFHIYPNMTEEKEIEKIVQQAKKEEKKHFSPSVRKNPKNSNTDIGELEKYTIESAEFTAPEYSDLKVVMDNQKSSSSKADNLKEKVRKHYGEETMRERECEYLTNTVCTGIHKGIKLYFTKGEYKTKDSLYFKNIADEAYEKNLAYFKKDELLYKRGIKNLEEIIKNSLLRNTEEYDIPSYSGDLVAKDLWKSVKNINNKIFRKTFRENQGSLSVDIILDQSASQYGRQSQVAIEGYIIAEALTNLNIKTRVVGFSNFYNYMIVREFRGYNDSKIKNQEIFRYNASGSNRDGLIIKLMSHFIEKSPTERKILIMLSDGKPNDEIDLGLIGVKNIDAEDYTDDKAILDSFNQVLISRLKGINVLGVFMGDEEDLEAEKKIFGQNFAYINDIKRFHHIVGIFFKSIANEYYF